MFLLLFPRFPPPYQQTEEYAEIVKYVPKTRLLG